MKYTVNKTIIIRSVCCVIAAFLLAAGCARYAGAPLPEGYVPALFVTGDVASPLRIGREEAAGFTWGKTQKEERELPSVELEEVVKAAAPRAAAYDILLVGSDGLISEIGGDDLTGCHLAFSEEFAWEEANDNHPVSANVKMLKEIVVVTREGTADPNQVNFVEGRDAKGLTPGQMRRMPLQLVNDFEGTNETGGLTATVYTPHYRAPLSDFMDTGKELCVVSRDGGVEYVNNGADAWVEQSGNQIDFVAGNSKIENIAGVMADAPKYRITEAFSDTRHILERGEPVLVIELDGWGGMMQEQAAKGGFAPFLSAQEKRDVMAAYPPISPVGLASMVTGTTPDAHGIHDRDTREFSGQDVFALARSMGKKAAYVEGDTALIATSLLPVLSPDADGDGYTDAEVFANAQKALADAPDLLFVHFHGIDDAATAKGPYAGETMRMIGEIDGYVQKLAQDWPGRVIVTADHGLHETPDGGAHGVFCMEDMVVPYLIFDGGAYIGKH